jgi:hypothetical protein
MKPALVSRKSQAASADVDFLLNTAKKKFFGIVCNAR